MMQVTFLGGVRTVTGSATLLEKDSLKWLVDCGMFQGGREKEGRNYDLQPYRTGDLSFILLTHAHIDHSGLIPRAVREGFRGKVICTKATAELCSVLLQDSAHIQEMEAEWEDRKGKRAGRRREALPLYTVKDAERCLASFQPVNYNEILQVADGVKVRFQDAGHILGSSILEIWVKEGEEEKKFVFSGDLGNSHHPLLSDPAIMEEGDFLWLESTYGNRLHKSKEDTEQELLKIIQEAVSHQAKVVIPAFAVERTQDIIYTLGQFIREGALAPIPVYIDSPLAISATEIFERNSSYFNQEIKTLLSKKVDLFDIPGIVFTRTTEESKAINEASGPGIIISASGMCDAGRIKHHLKHHLWQKDSHIVIIGFQAEGTIGRAIIDGAKTVRLFGEEIAVNAHIHTLGGFSSHADQKGLLDWASHFKNPQLEIFVNHGEENISLEFARLIQEQLHFKVSVPQWRERKVLFGKGVKAEYEERAVLEKREEPGPPSGESVSSLFHHLDKSYKRIGRKIRREQKKGEGYYDSMRMKQLEEINKKLEELGSILDEEKRS